MVKVTKELKNLVCNVSDGTDVILTGFRDSGKATAIEALAQTFDVQYLLQVREGMQSTKTQVSVISYEDDFDFLLDNKIGYLPEDALIVTADLKYPEEKDFTTDRTFERIILDCMDAYENQEEFKQSLAKELKQEFSQENAKPNSFYYKLDYSESCYMELLNTLYRLPCDLLKTWQKTLSAAELEIYEACMINLKSLMQNSDILMHLRNCFYQIAAKYMKQKINSIVNSFKHLGAYVEEITDLRCRLTAVFDATDSNHTLGLLLTDYTGLKWNLFTNVKLVFRGDDWSLSCAAPKIMKGVYATRIHSTPGLSEYTEAAGELLTETMSSTNCNKILFLIDATRAEHDLTTLSKIINGNAFNFIYNLKLCIVFTHFDRLLLNLSATDTGCSKFNLDTNYLGDEISNIHLKYTVAKNKLDKLIDTFKKKLSTKKQFLIGTEIAMLNTLGDYDGFSDIIQLYPPVIYDTIGKLLDCDSKTDEVQVANSISEMNVF